MKFLVPFLIALSSLTGAWAQTTTLAEDFNVACAATGTNYSVDGWSEYNTIAPVSALGWNCTPLGGRWGTGGVECSSYFAGVNYKDTAWLFTPPLYISGYPGSVYLRFDSKFEFIAARLGTLVSNNYHTGLNPDSVGVNWDDVSSHLNPVINVAGDSARWVTHWIDLTSFKGSAVSPTPVYVAFRYLSSASSGGVWTIDNVYTTPYGEGIQNLSNERLPLTIIGNSTTNTITFSCTTPEAGEYSVQIIDNLGRLVHAEKVVARSGANQFKMDGLNLVPALYIVKIGNESSFGVAKTVVQ